MARSPRSGRGRKAQPHEAEAEGDVIEQGDEDTGEAEAEAAPQPELPRAAWEFNGTAAQEKYDAAVAAAAAFARAEHNLPITTRKFAASCYDFVTALMPDLEGLRRALPRTAQPVEGGSILPQEVIDFLVEHDISPPHFRCTNPFHGIVATLYVQGRGTSKNLTLDKKEAMRLISEAEEADRDPDTIEDEEERKRYLNRRRAADATQQSKMAKWVLAAVDTAGIKDMGRDLIAGTKRIGYDTAVTKWQEWQQGDGKDKTISVVKAKTGRKSKADLEAEAARKAEAADRERQAADIRQRAQEPEPDEASGELITGSTIDGTATDVTEGETLAPEKETEEGIEAKDAGEGTLPEPAPEPAPEPEPERRYHAFSDLVEITLADDIIEFLPAKGSLVFVKEEGTNKLVLVGWEG